MPVRTYFSFVFTKDLKMRQKRKTKSKFVEKAIRTPEELGEALKNIKEDFVVYGSQPHKSCAHYKGVNVLDESGVRHAILIAIMNSVHEPLQLSLDIEYQFSDQTLIHLRQEAQPYLDLAVAGQTYAKPFNSQREFLYLPKKLQKKVNDSHHTKIRVRQIKVPIVCRMEYYEDPPKAKQISGPISHFFLN